MCVFRVMKKLHYSTQCTTFCSIAVLLFYNCIFMLFKMHKALPACLPLCERNVQGSHANCAMHKHFIATYTTLDTVQSRCKNNFLFLFFQKFYFVWSPLLRYLKSCSEHQTPATHTHTQLKFDVSAECGSINSSECGL